MFTESRHVSSQLLEMGKKDKPGHLTPPSANGELPLSLPVSGDIHCWDSEQIFQADSLATRLHDLLSKQISGFSMPWTHSSRPAGFTRVAAYQEWLCHCSRLHLGASRSSGQTVFLSLGNLRGPVVKSWLVTTLRQGRKDPRAPAQA